MKHFLLFSVLLLIRFLLPAQESHQEDRYVPDPDPAVRARIEAWQDLKFGLLMHWGAYSQWGIVESWSICPEEYGWCERREGSNPGNYYAYVKEYEALKTTFNPVKFDPALWAAAAREAGMRYVVFTTKHHDGFCMFDTKYTDYKVTDPGCPFAVNPKSNITREIFEAFRKENFWTGAYFSKPDWHSPWYWDPKYPPRDRNVNYEPEANPDQWNRFVDFTHNQVTELLSDYGRVDILWLDGGWVAKEPKPGIVKWYDEQLSETPNGYLKNRIVNQDIRMDELVDRARSLQPRIIVVDRAVPGKNQNYLTPENRVPDKPLPYPWESCIISGGGWAHTRDAKYMSGRDGVQLLVDIVAKGGNLLLNIAPTPEGEWQPGAYTLLKEYAAWMKVNAGGIYGSRPLPPYKEGNICLTANPDGSTYFFYLCREGEVTMPAEISITSHQPAEGAKVTLLGIEKPLKWKRNGSGFTVVIPAGVQQHPPCQHAWGIKVSEIR